MLRVVVEDHNSGSPNPLLPDHTEPTDPASYTIPLKVFRITSNSSRQELQRLTDYYAALSHYADFPDVISLIELREEILQALKCRAKAWIQIYTGLEQGTMYCTRIGSRKLRVLCTEVPNISNSCMHPKCGAPFTKGEFRIAVEFPDPERDARSWAFCLHCFDDLTRHDRLAPYAAGDDVWFRPSPSCHSYSVYRVDKRLGGAVDEETVEMVKAWKEVQCQRGMHVIYQQHRFLRWKLGEREAMNEEIIVLLGRFVPLQTPGIGVAEYLWTLRAERDKQVVG